MNNTSQNNDESEAQKTYPFGLRSLMETFDISAKAALAIWSVTLILITGAIVFFIHSAPPTSLTITTGPEGGSFQKSALKYQKILERNGVKLNILTSDGSLQNLQRLLDPKAHVDIGFVQAGITVPGVEKVHSLGSIQYQPLMLFYRGKPQDLISGFAGKKISVGPDGSGARHFALEILAANGIKEGDGSAEIFDWEADKASKALLDKKIDAAFIMSESAGGDILHNLLRNPDVTLFSFKQANAYSRKIDYLNLLDLPEGSIDFAKNIPAHDVSLLGPTIELIATKELHPALSDLILEAAVEVHDKAGTFQRRGEFPNALQHAIPISEDSARFFKSGKSFFYRYLSFWLASLMSRIVVVFIPLAVLLVPAVKSVPAALRWRVQMKIRRRYRELLRLEEAYFHGAKGVHLEKLRRDFDRIEVNVNNMKLSARYAEQFYGLRGHVDYVRGILFKGAV